MNAPDLEIDAEAVRRHAQEFEALSAKVGAVAAEVADLARRVSAAAGADSAGSAFTTAFATTSIVVEDHVTAVAQDLQNTSSWVRGALEHLVAVDATATPAMTREVIRG